MYLPAAFGPTSAVPDPAGIEGGDVRQGDNPPVTFRTLARTLTHLFVASLPRGSRRTYSSGEDQPSSADKRHEAKKRPEPGFPSNITRRIGGSPQNLPQPYQHKQETERELDP